MKLAEESQKAMEAEEAKNGSWTFKSKTTTTTSSSSSAPVIKRESESVAPLSFGKSKNLFESLEGIK